MDINKNLIMIKNEDKTDQIEMCQPVENCVKVKYKAGDKIYKYSKNQVEIDQDPIEVDIQNCTIIVSGDNVYNVEKVLQFDAYYRIFFYYGTSWVKCKDEVEFVQNDYKVLSQNKMEYYKDISKIESVVTESGSIRIDKEYDKINFIPHDVVLYKYLHPKLQINKLSSNLDRIIFPFGANKSQFNAVRNAMSNQITIIEGPPGTGKTQTILNIVANIVKNGKTVAVVSNNNAATDNVYEKLEKENLGYLCARLGKRENIERFIENQTGKYPKFSQELENGNIITSEVETLNKQIVEIFNVQNDIAGLKAELSEIKLQHEYFKNDVERNVDELVKIRNNKKISSSLITKLKIEYEEAEKINLWLKIKFILFYGIGNKKFYDNDKQYIINCFDRLFYITRELELENKIKEKEKHLSQLGNSKLPLLIKNSKLLLNEKLRIKYKEKQERKVYNINDLYKDANGFTEEYPIIFSTTYSITKCLNRGYKFDYIIMDESSQVGLTTGVLALSVAKNAVIVGDLKQLPNVVESKNKKAIEEINKKYEIDNKYNYLTNSFLSSLVQVLPNAPRIQLREHYRCHPKIIQFCNKKFYDDNLIIMTEDKGENDVLKAYKTVKGNHARGHVNQRQIDVIEKEIITELTDKFRTEDIGVISPYRDQKEEIDKTFGSQLKVETVHKFQGREEEAIVITTVDNIIGNFVDNPKMLNVAVTRARKALRVVVSDNEKNEGTNISDLIKYIQYNNFEIVESKIKSIYDLLYKENQKQRLKYLKNKKRISQYDSENLTYHLVEDVIKENNYNNVDIAVHVPLRDMITITELLDDREKKYARNALTHIDFVIFNKMDKKSVIALEVDGYAFHRKGTMQYERDQIKNSVLEKYGIPLIRFSTTGSGEKEKLKENIKTILCK